MLTVEMIAEIIWQNSEQYEADWEAGRAPEWDDLDGDLEYYREAPMKAAEEIHKRMTELRNMQ